MPKAIQAVPSIAANCDSTDPLLRERAVIALGRIGRGDYRLVEPYFTELFRMAKDSEAGGDDMNWTPCTLDNGKLQEAYELGKGL